MKNIPTDYLSVRVSLVNVKKKRFFGLFDEELSRIVAIPNTKEQSWEIYKRIGQLMRKYGVTLKEVK